MHLSDYLQREEMTVVEFARLIGVSHSAVVRYTKGQRMPGRGTMQKIGEVTGNAVQPNDFFAMPQPQPEAAA